MVTGRSMMSTSTSLSEDNLDLQFKKISFAVVIITVVRCARVGLDKSLRRSAQPEKPECLVFAQVCQTISRGESEFPLLS